MHLKLICVTPHLPDAASGLALSLICEFLWMAVEPRIPRGLQLPFNQIAPPECQGEVFQEHNLYVCVC